MKLESTNDQYKIGEVYKVRYDKNKYNAKLISIGSQIECEKELDRLIDYSQTTQLRQIINKSINKASSKQAAETNNDDLLKSEIECLKRKHEDDAERLENQLIRIRELERENRELKRRNVEEGLFTFAFYLPEFI